MLVNINRKDILNSCRSSENYDINDTSSNTVDAYGIKTLINDIYMVEGETLALDLSSYFHNEIENDLTFVSNIGEIIDGIFKYTATELGIKKVIISAISTEGVTSTNKFLIVINSITGEKNILYWNDFEHIPLRGDPGFKFSLNAVFDTEGYFGVCEDDRGNRAFRSNHNCLYKGTNTATKIFERSVYGDFELSVDLTAGFIEGTSVTYKEFNILNPEGNILMGFGFCSPSNDKEYEEMPGNHFCAFGRSMIHIDNFVAEQDVSFLLNVKMDSKTELLKVEINGSGRIVEIPLSNSNLISSKWGIGGISISTYYRAKTVTGHYFQMDNIEVKADIPVNLENIEILKREIKAFSWGNISSESIDNVTSHINLEDESNCGSNIVWHSSEPTIISPVGIVSRESKSKKVILTASFIKENAQLKKIFIITVANDISDLRKNILPLKTPVITSFPSLASMQSILAIRSRCFNWTLNHYIQLVYFQRSLGNKKSILSQFTDGLYNYNISTIFKCPYFHVDQISRRIIKKKWSDFVCFIKEYLNEGYYLRCFLNTKYFIQRSNYMKHDFPHTTLIYGYDENEKTVYVADFINSNAFQKFIVTYNEINLSFEDCTYDLDSAICFKFNNDVPELPLDPKIIRNRLIQYLSSEKDSEINYEPWKIDIAQYGISFYLELLNQMQLGRHDIRASHTLYDHKILMLKRIEKLYSEGFINNLNFEKLKSQNLELINKSLLLRNSVLKHMIKPDNLNKLLKMCNELMEMDKLFTQELVLALK